MSATVIRQAISEECLYTTLADWCKAGSGYKKHSLKILSAFASGAGVLAVSPLLDLFLADGNKVEIVFGSDRNGTDRDAVRKLYALQKAYRHQMLIRHFQAPAQGAIFHPKLYIYEHGSKMDFVIGSANLTRGGLGSNFESLLLYKSMRKTSSLARDVLSIWKTYADPKLPLKTSYLNELSKTHFNRLLARLPKRTSEDLSDGGRRGGRTSGQWRPLSHIPLVGDRTITQRKPMKPAQAGKKYLLMDILTETRKTQMQIPLDIVEGFFDTQRDKAQTVEVSIWTEDGMTQPIARPIVISGKDYGRLMRRLEMPQIKKLKRPLTVLFVQMNKKYKYAYVLFEKNTNEDRSASKLLDEYGRQDAAVRRYYIGAKNDKLWGKVQKLIPQQDVAAI
jgi:HKD family nuclease